MVEEVSVSHRSFTRYGQAAGRSESDHQSHDWTPDHWRQEARTGEVPPLVEEDKNAHMLRERGKAEASELSSFPKTYTRYNTRRESRNWLMIREVCSGPPRPGHQLPEQHCP